MQIGNRAALDTERNKLRDQFDAIWMACDQISDKEARAIRCAVALDKPGRTAPGYNWTIFPGGRICGPHNLVIYA